MSNLICAAFPIFFPARQGKSFRSVRAALANMILQVEISKPQHIWFDEAVHFGTSMVSIGESGIKRWPLPEWQRTNDVTTLAKSVRLALGAVLDDGWVPKLDSDYVKEVL